MLTTPIASTDISSTLVSSSTAVFGSTSQRETFSLKESVASAKTGVLLCLKKRGNFGASQGVSSPWKVAASAMKMAAP
ncbi:hypothetical protein RAD16_16515 [Bradyrhizobium sp. 18BD]